jgi:stearoyl-CoA desaturase (delta-9 desaturase)
LPTYLSVGKVFLPSAPHLPAEVNAMVQTVQKAPEDRIDLLNSIPFFLVHLSPVLIIWTGISVASVALCVGLYVLRMTAITAGYHRYFAHKSYKLSRVPQFALAFLGTTAAQKGPLWWAAHHRNHHRYADTDRDVHSPIRGFWWSHVGWILSRRFNETEFDTISDFAKFPELRFINKQNWIGPWAMGLFSYLLMGWEGLVVGFFLSTVLLWHGTFTVNSLAHVMGRRRYATTDTSRNSALVAVITGGEGWHNNHHYWPASARQGFFWWEIDTTYYLLRGLSFLGIVRDLKKPPERVRSAARVREGAFDIGMFRNAFLKARNAVSAAGSAAGDAVSDAMTGAREKSAEVVEAERQALDALLQAASARAEELGRLSRRGARKSGKLARTGAGS